MNTNTQSTRPRVVVLALIFLAVDVVVGIMRRILGTRSYHLDFYIQVSVMFLLLAVIGWFIFRGRNWARWTLVAMFVFGIGVRFPEVIAHIHDYSPLRISGYFIGVIADLIVLLALFHPSASRWFRAHTNVA